MLNSLLIREEGGRIKRYVYTFDKAIHLPNVMICESEKPTSLAVLATCINSATVKVKVINWCCQK